MSFRANLQHLRATRHMTQEQLAMLLGVSRQSVTKWEAEKAYPEMDKLIKMCQIFECTLDDLVTGDLTSASTATGTGAPDGKRPVNTPVVPSGPAVDVCGYDEFMRSVAWRVPTAVSIVLLSLALASVFDAGLVASFAHTEPLSTFALFGGIAVALAFFIPVGVEYDAFVKAHPYIEDFYTESDRAEARRRGSQSIVIGVGILLCNLALTEAVDSVGYESASGPLFLAVVAVGAWVIIHGVMMWNRVNIASYNKEAAQEIELDDIVHASIDDEYKRQLRALKTGAHARRQKLISTACGIIMIIATIISIVWLFFGEVNHGPGDRFFWLPWPIGGMLCGVATLLINALVPDDEQDA